MNEPQIERIDDFVCLRCTECCKQPGFVYLKEGEAERMAAFLKLNLYDFTDRFTEVEDRSRLVLKKNKDESCVLLNGSECRVHEAKPIQCKEFPVKWRTQKSLTYCAGLKKITSHS